MSARASASSSRYIGYVQQSADEIEVLFTLMAERYERRSMVDAILDRLVHNAYKLELKGPSRRKETTK